jgi:hypothetical protein
VAATSQVNGSTAPPPDAPFSEWARAYCELGLALTHLDPATKEPKHTGWNLPENCITDPDVAAAYWEAHPPHGMGSVHSLSGTAVPDIDSWQYAEDALSAVSLNLDLLLRDGARSAGKAGRAKAWYKIPDEGSFATRKLRWPHPTEANKFIMLLELRAGAVQDVLPPSIHPDTKQPYRWLRDASPWDLGGFPPMPPSLVYLWEHWDELVGKMEAMCPWPAITTARARATTGAPRQNTNTSEWDAVREQIRQRCGVEAMLATMGATSQRGKYLCPFHTERNASFWLFGTEDGYDMWTCAHGGAPVGLQTANGYSVGDVIDLHAHRFGTTTAQATVTMARELGLHLPGSSERIVPPSPNGCGPPPNKPPPNTEGGELPAIIVTNRPLRDIIADAASALVTANTPPVLYVRAGELTGVRHDEAGRPIIEPLSEGHIRGHHLSRSADYYRLKVEKTTDPETQEKGVNVTRVHVSPPREVVEGVLKMGTWNLPALNAVVTAPTLRPDGTILSTPGYDPSTRLLYLRPDGLTVPAIPDHPTQADAQARLAQLCDLVADFPFADEGKRHINRDNALGTLLTPLLRVAIPGCAPLAVLDKPRAGTGATLLADVVALLATGRTSALVTCPPVEEELRKKLTSLLLAAVPVAVLDNLERPFASESMAAILTTREWSDRALGSNRMVTVPQLTTWLLTGNNVRLAGDMPRRCYEIRLDANMARPWTREAEQFRHPNLPAWVLEHRGDLLAAVLTMARAWWVAGQPASTVPAMGGFQEWARTVGGILAYAGATDFLGNLENLWEANDDEALQWDGLLSAWHEVFGNELVSVASIGSVLSEDDTQGRQLRDALPDDLADAYGSEQRRGGFRKRLGKALARHVDGIYGQYRLRRAGTDSHTKAQLWQVERVQGGR